MTTHQRFQLGQRVQMTGCVRKLQRTGFQGMSARTMYQPAGAPASSGIIVGKRTITDHAVQWAFDDGTSASPIPGTARTAWLVSWDLHRQPVLCLDSQVYAQYELHPVQDGADQ